MQRPDHLEQASGARGGLEVADVRLHRAKGDRAGLGPGRAEDRQDALQLGSVADAGRGAVRLDRGGQGRVDPSALPGPRDGELLPDRVGGGDALALAVGRATDAEDEGVDLVAVALGVGEPLEDEQGCALTHDEAIGAGVEGPGAGGRQGTDLAELDEGVDTHVAVDATGDHRVVLVVVEAEDRGVERGQAGRAGGVGRVVGATQVEHVGDPAGDDVGQLTGHGVLGDLEHVVQVERPGLFDDLVLHVGREGLQGRRLGNPPQRLGQLDTHARQVVLLAADGVAEDDRHLVAVDRPLGPPGIHEGPAGRRQRPPLTLVHLRRHRRRDGQLPPDRVPLELADPAADRRVRLVPGRVIGGVVERGVPALRRHVGDAVPPSRDVGPEGIGVRGHRHDGRDADDGDGVDVGHGVVSFRWCTGSRGVLRSGSVAEALDGDSGPAVVLSCGRRWRRPRRPCP
ncbi:MAG: hypothetical protein BWY91_01201 [bacterium ADurb.BinA028]|nr:MAG: hypothetical protein BWY91_01201 [bacterium ADurb.BinA028]